MSRLKRLRIKRGYTQEKMQLLTGIDQSTYSELERGLRPMSTGQCIQLALALQTSADCQGYPYMEAAEGRSTTLETIRYAEAGHRQKQER